MHVHLPTLLLPCPWAPQRECGSMIMTWMMPYCGSVIVRELHAPQTTEPHDLQWCILCIRSASLEDVPARAHRSVRGREHRSIKQRRGWHAGN